MAITDGFYALGRDFNKAPEGSPDAEGVVGELLPELDIQMTDEELLALKKKWEGAWKDYEGPLKKRQDTNENYWLGKQFSTAEMRGQDRPLADNRLFMAIETFLPIACRENPNPMVDADETPDGTALAKKVQKVLSFLADELTLKLKLQRTVRNWSLFYLGVMKIGWSQQENEIDLKVLRPQKLMLDPESTILEDGTYTGEWIGEERTDTAKTLIAKFPNKLEIIKDLCQGKLGTEMQYAEWWTDEYVFWTIKDKVLGGAKNPHWNYPSEQVMTDEFGNQQMEPTPGNNHFKQAKKPYVFLSVFNLGKHPHDDTSLLEQNLAMQDLINKRLRQIDKNADSMNGCLVVSGERSGLTKEEAAAAMSARQKGGSIWVPRGAPAEAVTTLQGVALPGDVYQSLIDYRNELDNIFGTGSSTPQALQQETTVRGKIMARSQDESRIGGGISVFIEQFADSVFNYMVQMMYVYYDTPHVASIIGDDNAGEYVQLQMSDLNRQLLVSVKEGSMVPHDPLTERNQAIDLWSAGATDPISLYTALDAPDPIGAAERLFLWQTNPIALFPNLQGQAASPPQPGAPTGGGQLQTAPTPQQAAPQVAQDQSSLANVPLTGSGQ